MTQTYNLNMIPGNVPVMVHVKQYDTAPRQIVFNLFSGDTVFSVVSGNVVTVSGTKPDKTGFAYTATFSGNVVTVTMREQMTVLAGEVPCQLTVSNGTGVIGTATFILAVAPAALADDTEVSETDIPVFQDLLTQVQNAAATAGGYNARITANENAISTLNSNSILTITRTENDHVSATSLSRAAARKRGNMLWLSGNLEIAYGGGFGGAFTEVGVISGWNAVNDAYVNVPAQNDGTKVVAVVIRYNGKIEVYSSTAFSGSPFFRFYICVPAT